MRDVAVAGDLVARVDDAHVGALGEQPRRLTHDRRLARAYAVMAYAVIVVSSPARLKTDFFLSGSS